MKGIVGLGGNPIRIPKKTTQTTNFPFVDNGMWKKMAAMYISDDVGEKHRKEKKNKLQRKKRSTLNLIEFWGESYSREWVSQKKKE